MLLLLLKERVVGLLFKVRGRRLAGWGGYRLSRQGREGVWLIFKGGGKEREEEKEDKVETGKRDHTIDLFKFSIREKREGTQEGIRGDNIHREASRELSFSFVNLFASPIQTEYI